MIKCVIKRFSFITNKWEVVEVFHFTTFKNMDECLHSWLKNDKHLVVKYKYTLTWED